MKIHPLISVAQLKRRPDDPDPWDRTQKEPTEAIEVEGDTNECARDANLPSSCSRSNLVSTRHSRPTVV